jgi:hypothetical protein
MALDRYLDVGAAPEFCEGSSCSRAIQRDSNVKTRDSTIAAPWLAVIQWYARTGYPVLDGRAA